MSLKQNLIANYVGASWAALISFAMVPIYLRFIGAEGYGLVGFFVMLSASLTILDGGLGAAATRESAKYLAVDTDGRKQIATLLSTMEVIYWALALLVGGAVALAAPVIVDHWLNISPTSRNETIEAVRWMSLAVLVQFPLSFYNGCLNGLQKQVGLNLLNVIGATLRSVGAALVLWLISPTVETFFAWNALGGLALVVAHRAYMFSCFNGAKHGDRFSFAALAQVKHFMAGVGAINVMALILTQLDKLILSKVLSLHAFGYYSLAWMLGTLVYRLTGPIFNAYYPKIIEHHETSNQPAMMATYLQSCRLMALAVVPISLWLAFFSTEILLLWTRNEEIAKAASGALSVIAVGTMCNAFMHMPFAIQLAHGHTRLALMQNTVAVIVIGPLTWFLATHYGLTEAAIPWLIVNLGCVLISPFVMYKLLSLNGFWEWFRDVILIPVAITSAIMWLAGLVLRLQYHGVWSTGIILAMVFCMAVFSNFLFSGMSIFKKS